MSQQTTKNYTKRTDYMTNNPEKNMDIRSKPKYYVDVVVNRQGL